MPTLEQHFEFFRRGIIGHDQIVPGPYGDLPLIYADWTASGRLYRPIERRLSEEFGPWLGNTHSEASTTGMTTTWAYHEARRILKAHVRATADDLLLTCGSGMTGAVNKFQRILGLKAPPGLRRFLRVPETERPIVFITHMEHHSNQTSWLETIAEVVVIPPDERGGVDLGALDERLDFHRKRPVKIGAFTACSNVTGVATPYRALAQRMHRAGGVALVDFAAAAPYVEIDMHPPDPEERLDAVVFSPHKFLGGPGATGVLVFNRALHHNAEPDEAGGGTVEWTNPWGGYAFHEDIEAREDAGTPPFLPTIKAAMAVGLKEQMGIEAMARREAEIVPRVLNALSDLPKVHLLAPGARERQPIFSFYVEGIHYNLVVRLLNDRFGIQSRGGCSCAGTYGHYLLHVDPARSHRITGLIDQGDLSEKPGWVRISFHPTSPDAEIDQCQAAIRATVENASAWSADYSYSSRTNEFTHRNGHSGDLSRVRGWFDFGKVR